MTYPRVCMELVLDLLECGYKCCGQALHHGVLHVPSKLVFFSQFGVFRQVFWESCVGLDSNPSQLFLKNWQYVLGRKACSLLTTMPIENAK